jgi:polar amino acid transport system substrate-binding protein
VPAFENDGELAWNVAVGMLRPDDELRRAIDGAVSELLADGTIGRIYARYGAELRPPR